MNIQSLSIVVPNNTCVNHCPFCVSRMHCDTYKNQLDENLPFFDLYMDDYLKRLQFARDNGCNTVMLTGTSEPQQNKKFLTWFGMFQRMLKSPFQWIEMQTTGVMLDEAYLRFLRNHVGVNLISLSLSSLDSKRNCDIISCPDKLRFDLDELCALIKRYDFSLRLSINLTSEFDSLYQPDKHGCINPGAARAIFNRCEAIGADQVTFRVLYSDNTSDTPQSHWIAQHAANAETITHLKLYVQREGTKLGQLPFGATKYSIHGISTIIDDDCMAKNVKHDETYKYLILRPNCKLYSSWDDKASLIF